MRHTCCFGFDRLRTQSGSSSLRGSTSLSIRRGLVYSDGVIGIAGDRENTRTKIEAEDAGDLGQAESQSKLTGGLKVDRKTGKQANGYTVKLAEKSEAAVIELLKDGEDKD